MEKEITFRHEAFEKKKTPKAVPPKQKRKLTINSRAVVAILLAVVLAFAGGYYTYALSVEKVTIGDRLDQEFKRDGTCSITKTEWIADFDAGAFDFEVTVRNDFGSTATFDVDLLVNGVDEYTDQTISLGSGNEDPVDFDINVADFNNTIVSSVCSKV